MPLDIAIDKCIIQEVLLQYPSCFLQLYVLVHFSFYYYYQNSIRGSVSWMLICYALSFDCSLLSKLFDLSCGVE
jgi:hypothetical protein